MTACKDEMTASAIIFGRRLIKLWRKDESKRQAGEVGETRSADEIYGGMVQTLSPEKEQDLAIQLVEQFNWKINHDIPKRIDLRGLNEDDLVDEIIKEMTVAMNHNIAVSKRNMVVTGTIAETSVKNFDSATTFISYLGGPPSAAGIRRSPEGELGVRAEGDRYQIDRMQDHESGKRHNTLLLKIEEADLTDFANTPSNAPIVRSELFDALKDPNYKPAPSANKQAAHKLAMIIKEEWEISAKKADQFGASKGPVEDAFELITGLNKADQSTVMQMDKDVWVEFMAPLLDQEQPLITSKGKIATKDEPEIFIEYVGELYENIKWGKNQIFTGEGFDGPGGRTAYLMNYQNIIRTGFPGPGSRAQIESMPRQWKFKSKEAANIFADKMTKRSLMDNVFLSLEQTTRNTVLMRELGPNPEPNLIQITRHVNRELEARAHKIDKEIQVVKKELSEKPTDKKLLNKVKKLRAQAETLTNERRLLVTPPGERLPKAVGDYLKVLDNSANSIQGSPRFAFVSRALRVGTAMAKLGMATPSSIPDIGYQTAHLANVFTDLPRGKAFIKVMGNLFHGVKGQSKARKQFGANLGLGANATKGNMLYKMGGATGDFPGKLTQGQNLYFKWNGQQIWNDSHQLGTGIIFASELQNLHLKSYDNLPLRERQNFDGFRIERGMWDFLRKHAIREIDGVKVIDPTDININDPKIRKSAQDILDKTNDLLDKHFDYPALIKAIKERRALASAEIMPESNWGVYHSKFNDETFVIDKTEVPQGRDRAQTLNERLSKIPDEVLNRLAKAKPKSLTEAAMIEGVTDDIIGLLKTKQQPRGEALPGNQWFKEVTTIDTWFDSLKARYGNMIYTLASDSVMLPGAYERSWAKKGGNPGTFWGEFSQFFMQFKAFPFSALRRGGAQTFAATGVEGVMTMMALVTILGGVSIQSKQWFLGRTARAMDNWTFWFDSWMQGGAGGIYADVITSAGRFGDRFGYQTAIGPGPSSAIQLLAAFGTTLGILTKDEDDRHGAAALAKFSAKHLPFQNLFYTKMAFDFILLNYLMELGSPGYLNRLENRIMKERGQRLMFDGFGTSNKLFSTKQKLFGD